MLFLKIAGSIDVGRWNPNSTVYIVEYAKGKDDEVKMKDVLLYLSFRITERRYYMKETKEEFKEDVDLHFLYLVVYILSVAKNVTSTLAAVGDNELKTPLRGKWSKWPNFFFLRKTAI